MTFLIFSSSKSQIRESNTDPTLNLCHHGSVENVECTNTLPNDKWYGIRNLDILRSSFAYGSQLLDIIYSDQSFGYLNKIYIMTFCSCFCCIAALLMLHAHLQGIRGSIVQGGNTKKHQYPLFLNIDKTREAPRTEPITQTISNYEAHSDDLSLVYTSLLQLKIMPR